MAYAIRIKTSALRELGKLRREDQVRVRDRIEALAGEPRPHGARSFRGIPDAYRVRIGSLRVVYQVLDAQGLIEVVLVGDRKDVYRRR